MGELAKIESFRKDLALAETIEEIKLIGDATEAYQSLMIKQNVAKKSIDEIGEFDIEIKEKEAQWLDEFYPGKEGRMGNKREPIKMPVSKKESAMVRRLKRTINEKPEKVKKIKEEIKKSKKPLNAKTLDNELKKEENKELKNQGKLKEEPADNIDNTIMINVNKGDIIKLGNHILYCNDAYKINVDADILITDPPYGINYEPNWKKWDGSKSDFKKIIGDTESFNPAPFMKYKTMLFFGANYYSNNLPIGGWLVWDKRMDEVKDKMIGSPFELAWFISEHTERKAIIKRLLHGGVVNADSEIGNNEKRFHPTQKPIVLLKSIIEDLTIENEVIFDPFAGSGSTLIACELTGRKCIAIEIEPEYCSIIILRWEKITGKKAEWIAE